MSLSSTTAAYLISGMGSTIAGNNLVSAIQNQSALSTNDFTRLTDCLSRLDVSQNFQGAILGSYSLSPLDVQFVKDGFSLPDASLSELIANLAGGVQAPIFPNFLPPTAANQYPNAFSNGAPISATMPAGFVWATPSVGPAKQQWDVLTFPAGSAFASTGAGQYFQIFTGGNSNQYYIWYSVSGGSNTDPAPAGFTGIEVVILSGDTAAQVASKTNAALNATTGGAGFAILGASAVSNTGSSVLNGDLGIYPSSSITGFPPGTFTGAEHIADGAAAAAQTAAQASFTAKQTLGAAGTIIPSELGGQTLTPGNYHFTSGSAGLSLTSGHSTLTFNGAGQYIIYTASTLLTGASGSTDLPVMVLSGGATAANIFWIVGSSATINQSVASSGAVFQGNVIAQASVTVTQSSVINGSLTALTAAVTLSAASTVNPPISGPVTGVLDDAASSVSGAVVTLVLAPFSSQVARPKLSLASGTYHGTQSVTVSSGTAGATFYYTVDGSVPSPQSTLYSGPISVASSETINVIGIAGDFANSRIGSASYVIV